MLVLGIDVTIMCVTGLICIIGVGILAWKNGLDEEHAELVIGTNAITAAIMIVSYIVMACVLDRVIGIYW